MKQKAKSKRSQVHRIPARGSYDDDTVYAILDEARICHVGFVDQEQPFVIPSIHTRIGNHLYLHGAPASRMLKGLARGIPVCVTVTLLDGLVLAKSAFHHSMNYRSVMVFGQGALVTDREEKLAAFESLVEDQVVGRWGDCRHPNEKEITSTAVLRVAIDEASAKIRTGPPVDDQADMSLPHWSGVVTVEQVLGNGPSYCPPSDNLG